ncbi:MAG TPA: ABC transporter permease subunit [Gammaproteobacteria bacterium]|nr:ABC transporter permease subunit [Gammaproteobacteria bacterium]
MPGFTETFGLALQLIFSGSRDLVEIVMLSLQVSISAVLLGCLVGLPLGAWLVVGKFPGRTLLQVLINAFMGLPPVVIGLVVYLALSHSGPFGVLDLLYSATAMVIAQMLLVTPLVAALARQHLDDLYLEYRNLFASLNLSSWQIARALLWDARYSLLTVSLAGFGRAIAEVGAVMIVGGNINHLTRVMTTTIALETSKGDLGLALALGIILISLSVTVNAAVMGLRSSARRLAYA